MKKNKLIVLAGMVLIAVGTILNVHDAFNEFGVLDISLHPQVLAQAGGVKGTTTGFGEQLSADVDCEKKTTTTSGSSSSAGSTAGNHWDAGVSAGNGVIGGSAGGGQSWGNTTSTNNSTTTTTTTTEKFTGKKYYCGTFEYVRTCSITNPCEQ